MVFPHKSFSFILWNSRSGISNRAELNILLWTHNPDIIDITETWLSDKVTLEMPNFITIRQDRPNGRGGGVLILIRREISFLLTNLFTYQSRDIQIDVVSITLNTLFGKTKITCLYAPLGGISPLSHSPISLTYYRPTLNIFSVATLTLVTRVGGMDALVLGGLFWRLLR